MSRMRMAASVLAALALLCTDANAGSFANARRLVEAVDLHGQLDLAIEQVITQTRTQLYASGAPAQQIERLVEAIEVEMRESTPDLIAEITQIYADRFTDAEINDLVAFFKSPTGQKLASTQIELATAQMNATQRWLMGVAERAQARIENFSPSV